jgi:hypothetical protein
LFASVDRSLQVVPHIAKFESQDQPHAYAPPDAVQLAVVLAGAVQGEHEAPQLFALVSSAHVALAPDPHR